MPDEELTNGNNQQPQVENGSPSPEDQTPSGEGFVAQGEVRGDATGGFTAAYPGLDEQAPDAAITEEVPGFNEPPQVAAKPVIGADEVSVPSEEQPAALNVDTGEVSSALPEQPEESAPEELAPPIPPAPDGTEGELHVDQRPESVADEEQRPEGQ